MYLTKTPLFIQSMFPRFLWKVTGDDKVLFLTFDDGPIPDVTPWVLDTLEEYSAKATFFCVGNNVRKNPEVYNRITSSGHSVGNHTYSHLNGWKTDLNTYIKNVKHCDELIDTKLFRPPYGRLKPAQAKELNRDYKIIMWDVLSGDFDPTLTVDQCFENIILHAVPGSIIVMHDSLKAEGKIKAVLPMVLDYYSALDYRFESLESVLSPARVLV